MLSPVDGDVAELGEEEACEGFDAFAGELPVELGAEVTESGGAVERHDAGGAGELRSG